MPSTSPRFTDSESNQRWSRSRRLNDRFHGSSLSLSPLPFSLCLLFIGHGLLFQGSYVDTSAAYWQPAASRIIGVIVVGIPRSPYGSRPTRSPCFFAVPAFPHRDRPSRGHLPLRDYLIIFNCQSSVFTAVLAWRTIIAYDPPYARLSKSRNFSKSMPASEPRRFRFFSARYFYELVHLRSRNNGNKGKTHCTRSWRRPRYWWLEISLLPTPGGGEKMEEKATFHVIKVLLYRSIRQILIIDTNFCACFSNNPSFGKGEIKKRKIGA